MGCGGSKVDDLPLVTLCRERKDFLKAASEQRYALAAAHVAYFQSLRDIGDALRKFADHDLVFASATGSSSSPSSPVLTLPSDEGKPSKKKKKNNNKRLSSSSTSISHGDSPENDEIEGGSHLHLSDSESELRSSSSGHIHIEEDEEVVEEEEEAPPPYGYGYHDYHQPQDWGHQQGQGVNTYAFYMKRSAPRGRSMVYEEPETRVAESGRWPDPQYGYGYGYPGGGGGGGGGGFFGFPMGSPPPGEYPYYAQQRTPSPAPPPPAPPSPPRVSAWDFLNFFDSYDSGYPGYLSQGRFGLGSNSSSPDSKEVREREGIPELEDETEQEAMKEVLHKEKKKLGEEKATKEQQQQHFRERDFGEGTSNSKAVPVPPQQQQQQNNSSEGSSNKAVRFHGSDDGGSLHEKEIKSSSPDTIFSKSSPEQEQARKKGVTFEVEATVTAVDGGDSSSKLSSLTTLSPHGTRDLREVVQEIRDEFETASNFGKEVALLLEVCKPPYRSRVAAFKGINVI